MCIIDTNKCVNAGLRRKYTDDDVEGMSGCGRMVPRSRALLLALAGARS